VAERSEAGVRVRFRLAVTSAIAITTTLLLAPTAPIHAAGASQSGVPYGSGAPEPGDVTASLAVRPTRLTIGDPITITLAVTHPAGVAIIPPRLGPAWGDFEIRAQSPMVAADIGGGMAASRQAILATLFVTGTVRTPPVEVVAVGGGETVRHNVPGTSVTVASVLNPGETEPADIKPQAVLAMPPRWPWVAAAVAFAAAVAAVVAWGVRRWWLRPAPALALVPAFVDPRSPWEVAKDELDRVDRLSLVAREMYKEHYTLVADCVRRYVEATRHFGAMEMTTMEIARELGRAGASMTVRRPVESLLIAADLVKFARRTPAVGEAEGLTGAARAVLDALHAEDRPHAGAPVPETAGAPPARDARARPEDRPT